MKKIVALFLCCIMLSGCTNSQAETTQATTPTQETATLPSETVIGISPEIMRFTVFTPNENYDGFITTEVEGDALSPLEELIKAGILTKDVQINNVRWESGNSIVYVDFNSAFGDLMNSQGTTGEYMIMGCVVNTLLSAYEAEQIYVTVDSNTLESGHVIYDFPMGYFE